MKILIVCEIHRLDLVILAPKSFKRREKFHTFQGFDSKPLTVDVDGSRNLVGIQITVPVSVVFRTCNHRAEDQIREILIIIDFNQRQIGRRRPSVPQGVTPHAVSEYRRDAQDCCQNKTDKPFKT